ncbi:MAG: hypothetical protein OXI83_03280 [Gemmatimonadota bacterium]|nr:hypothetical protein [Gemmatimonadota bacterium]
MSKISLLRVIAFVVIVGTVGMVVVIALVLALAPDDQAEALEILRTTNEELRQRNFELGQEGAALKADIARLERELRTATSPVASATTPAELPVAATGHDIVTQCANSGRLTDTVHTYAAPTLVET